MLRSLLERLLNSEDMWEASPTPISRDNTIRRGLVADIGVRDPPTMNPVSVRLLNSVKLINACGVEQPCRARAR
jgi:hypothetical protein